VKIRVIRVPNRAAVAFSYLVTGMDELCVLCGDLNLRLFCFI
jgi:hypothetical protein